ncbi:MAG: sulfatase-like hydrolase/transferase [Vicinamibacterales bacterium]
MTTPLVASELEEGEQSRRGLAVFALALGLGSGLTEGVGHMALQVVLHVLDNSWYPIIWIAAVFNGLLVGSAGALVGAVVASFRASEWVRGASIFGLFVLSGIPVLALTLKEWIYPSAILLLTLGLASTATRWVVRHQTRTWGLTRRALPWLIGLTALALVSIEGGGRLQEQIVTARLPVVSGSPPDVLVVVIDTLRSDHLASYGYNRHTSPNLDRMATEGVLFENAFAASSYTLPSHASMLTGLPPRDHGLEWDTSHRLNPIRTPTLPEALQARGYRTGGFTANTFYFTREHGFGRGFMHFEDFYHSVEDMAWRTAYGGIATRLVRPRLGFENLPARKLASDVNGAVLRWVGQDLRPFFVMINYVDAHDPYLPPEPYRSKFSGRPDTGGLLNSKVRNTKTLSPDQLQGEIDAYDGAVAYVDDYLGRLVSALQQRPVNRDLLVVVTSDHGEEFFEHGGFFHTSHLYRELIQVPLIFWQPRRLPGGVRVSRPVTNASIPATVMELTETEGTAFKSPSLRALWEGNPPGEWPLPLAELNHQPWAPERDRSRLGSMRSVVDSRWHFIEQDGQPSELYDWIHDPQERDDLARRVESKPVLEYLRGQLK